MPKEKARMADQSEIRGDDANDSQCRKRGRSRDFLAIEAHERVPKGVIRRAIVDVRGSSAPGTRRCAVYLSFARSCANRLKNDVSFQRGRSSRLATRSSSFATSTSNAPAACLSTGCATSSEGA